MSLLLLSPGIISGQICSQVDTNVLVLGGGIAGVAAARTLHNEGITDFMIIEAQPQLGGRLRTIELRPGSGITLNAGANWIHGYDPAQPGLHPLIQIVNTSRCGGIQGTLSDYDSLVVRNSRGMDISDSPNLRYDDYDAALAVVKTLSEMRQRDGLPDITVREALTQSGWTPTTAEDEWVDWFSYDSCFAKPPDNSSLFATIPLPTYSDFGDPNNTGNFFITDSEGILKVIRCLADEFLIHNDPRVHLNATVKRIEWNDECVCVMADENGLTRRFCGQHGILTFSIGVLQELEKAGIAFEPPLPQDKVDAINQFRMTHYLNVIIEFENRFWESVDFIGYVNETNGRYFPFFQHLTHIRDANVVYSTLTDTVADRVIRQDREQTKQEIVDVFNNAYNLTLQPSDIRTLIIPDWDTNPLFLGSYSNIPIGVTDETYVTIRKPLGNRLFISGEVTSKDYSGFVHGGFFSGVDSAEDVISEIRRSSGKGLLMMPINLCLLTAIASIGIFISF